MNNTINLQTNNIQKWKPLSEDDFLPEEEEHFLNEIVERDLTRKLKDQVSRIKHLFEINDQDENIQANNCIGLSAKSLSPWFHKRIGLKLAPLIRNSRKPWVDSLISL